MSITIKINEPKIIQKITNDRFGVFVSHEWKKQINLCTPRENGILEQNVEELPFALHYREPYSHYVYEGLLYVDPEYKVGAFYSPEYGFWSRPNVKKVPSDRRLQYRTINPYSTDHWDIKAAQAGQLNGLYRTINSALKSGRI